VLARCRRFRVSGGVVCQRVSRQDAKAAEQSREELGFADRACARRACARRGVCPRVSRQGRQGRQAEGETRRLRSREGSRLRRSGVCPAGRVPEIEPPSGKDAKQRGDTKTGRPRSRGRLRLRRAGVCPAGVCPSGASRICHPCARSAPRSPPGEAPQLQLGVLGALGGSPSRTRSRAHGASKRSRARGAPTGATDAVSATCYADVQ